MAFEEVIKDTIKLNINLQSCYRVMSLIHSLKN